MRAEHLIALVEVTRPHSALAAAFAVIAGAHLAGAVPSSMWLQAAAVAWFLSAAGNSFNDSLDVAVDAMNRPGRPIPSGRLSVRAARMLAHTCALSALVLAVPLGFLSTLGTVMGILLLYGYSLWLRNIPLVGNAVVGVLSGMAMMYGELLGKQGTEMWWGVVLVFLFMFTREVLKTVPDEEGDRAAGIQTVMTVGGDSLATRIGLGGGILMAVLPAAVWMTDPVITTGGFVVATVYYTGLGYGLLWFWHRPDKQRTRKLIVASKVWGIAMLLMVVSL